jgi:hypothetical protein
VNHINVLFVYLHDMSGMTGVPTGSGYAQVIASDWDKYNKQNPGDLIGSMSRLGIQPHLSDKAQETIEAFCGSMHFRLFALGLSPVNVSHLTQNSPFPGRSAHNTLSMTGYFDNQGDTQTDVIENLVYDTLVDTSAIASLYASPSVISNTAHRGRNIRVQPNAMMKAGDDTIEILTSQATGMASSV